MKNLRPTSEFQRRLATVNTGVHFTTRILEKGTGLRNIHELLGRGSSKTTNHTQTR